MDIELIRDWMLIVYLGIGSIAVCVILAFFIIMSVKLNAILNSTRETVENVRDTSSLISRTVVQPIAKAQGIFAGMRKIVDVVTSFTRSEEEKNER